MQSIGSFLPPTPRSAFTNELCSTLLRWTQPPCCVYSFRGLNPHGTEVWLPRSVLGVSLHLWCSFQLSLVLLCVSRRSGPCSEWKPFPWLHPAPIALLLGEGSCLLQVLCSCPHTAELSLGHPSNPRLGCSFSRALSWYLWWFGTCCLGRWGGSASVRTVLFVY